MQQYFSISILQQRNTISVHNKEAVQVELHEWQKKHSRNDMFLRQISQWNNQKDNGKSPWASLKPAAMKHLCLPCSGKQTARHHSCKMSSGASSKAERLTLIHKQLPLSLCCRFRTAVPPNISLSCLANIEKKKDRASAFSPQKKKANTEAGKKRQTLANQKGKQKDKGW